MTVRVCPCCGKTAGNLVGPFEVGRYKVYRWDPAKEDHVESVVERKDMHAFFREDGKMPEESWDIFLDYLDDRVRLSR